jgi:hypothetical protein
MQLSIHGKSRNDSGTRASRNSGKEIEISIKFARIS